MLVALALCSTVHAQEPSGEAGEVDQALPSSEVRTPEMIESERLFEQGVRYAAEEDFLRSAEAFAHSLSLFRSQNTAFNLAQILYRGGQGVRALELTHSLSNGDYGVVSEEGHHTLRDLQRTIREGLARVLVRTDPPRGNATLLVDGSEAGATDDAGQVAAILDAGDHLLELHTPEEAARLAIEVGASERREITMTLRPNVNLTRRRLAIVLPIVAVLLAATAVTLTVKLRQNPSQVLDPVIGDIQLLRAPR